MKEKKEIRVYIEPDQYGKRYVEGRWIELPTDKKNLERLLLVMTGKTWGCEYAITDYRCPYFKIMQEDDVFLINKLAEIIKGLDHIEKDYLKKWCEKYQNEYPDLTEICNAALQMKRFVGRERIDSQEEINKKINSNKYSRPQILMNESSLLLWIESEGNDPLAVKDFVDHDLEISKMRAKKPRKKETEIYHIKSKEKLVRAWRLKHPNGSTYQCAEELGICIETARKWFRKIDAE